MKAFWDKYLKKGLFKVFVSPKYLYYKPFFLNLRIRPVYLRISPKYLRFRREYNNG